LYLLDTGWRLKKTASAGEELFKTIVNNQPLKFSNSFSLWQKNFTDFKNRILEVDRLSRGYLDRKYELRKYLDLIGQINSLLPLIVSQSGQKTYYVLLQNNMELRPTGGFMGSYAKLKFQNGSLVETLIQDIYVPDGQITGHVDPPWPIQEAFKTGFWKLRDANWDPDFPSAAKTIDWFFQKGKEEKADGMIAINLLTVKKLLKTVGPLYLSDYKQMVNEGNFYQITQSYTETDFFAGSTQKKDILSALGKAFFEKFKNLSLNQTKNVMEIIYEDLNQRQILVSFNDPILAGFFSRLGWDGSMRPVVSSTSQLNDYLYLVETNLGANKANCCLERKVEQEVNIESRGDIKEKLKIDYHYQSGFMGEITPIFPGEPYINFLRFYLPEIARLTQIKVDGKAISLDKRVYKEEKKELGLRGYGFFVKIAPLAHVTVEVEYELNNSFGQIPPQYRLLVQKQPGIESYPLALNLLIDGKHFWREERLIKRDEEIVVDLMYNKSADNKQK